MKDDSYLSPSHHCPGMNCCSGRWCMTALSPGCCYTHCRTQVQMFFSSCDEKETCRDWLKIWFLIIHKPFRNYYIHQSNILSYILKISSSVNIQTWRNKFKSKGISNLNIHMVSCSFNNGTTCRRENDSRIVFFGVFWVN